MARKRTLQRVRNIGDASFAVLDAEGKLIAGHNPDMRQDPASTTKMHTLQVLGALDKEGALPEGFWQRHDATIRRMMVRSDNGAANALARAAMGSERAFVERMNAEAERIGLSDTHFVTVDGMPAPEHYSTARDMAQMAHHFKTTYPELADTYAGIRKNNTAGALASEFDGIKTGTATGYHGGTGRKSMVGFVAEGAISVAGAANPELRASIMRTALGELKSGRKETLQAHMDNRFVGRPEISTEQYYRTIQETFAALDAAGAGSLKKIAVAVSGVESDFGAPNLFRREQARPDRYIGVFQLGTEHSRYLNGTQEAQALREIGVLKGEPLPGRNPYDPYKNQGVLGAVALMHYAGIAREVTGKSDAELTARDIWTLHLFGQNGGKALMAAAQENPDLPLHELTFKYGGRDIKAVSRAAFNGNIGPGITTINSERLSYNKVTVGQAFDLVQNHFDRRGANLPAHLDRDYTQAFMVATRTEQPRANPDNPGGDDGLQRIERIQEQRIAAARQRMGVEAPIQLAHLPENGPIPLPRPDTVQLAGSALAGSAVLAYAPSTDRTDAAKDSPFPENVLLAAAPVAATGRMEVAQDVTLPQNVPLPLPRPAHLGRTELAQNVSLPQNVPLPLPRPAHLGRTELAQNVSLPQNVPLPLPRPAHLGRTELAQNVPVPLPRPAELGRMELAQHAPWPLPKPDQKPFEALPALARSGNQRVRQTENAYRLLGLESQEDRARFRERHDIRGNDSAAEFAALKGEVEKVQRSLTENGIQLGRYGVDGIVGAETHAAITRYRNRTGMELTALNNAREAYQAPAGLPAYPSPQDQRIAPDILPNRFAANDSDHPAKFAQVRKVALAVAEKLPPMRGEDVRVAEATNAAPAATPNVSPATERREAVNARA